MTTVTLTEADEQRADILRHLVAKKTTVSTAAVRLDLTERQVRRLRASFERDALASIPHKNRGRKPVHAMTDEEANRIWDMANPKGIYHDFNTCHLTEILAKEHNILIGRSTLQRFLHGKRFPLSAKPERKPSGRTRRLRKASVGEMIQIDGSLHDWLEGRGPKMCLMGGIDDASNGVVHLRFWVTETAAGYLHMFRDIAANFGLPASYYHDKHTILRSPKKTTIDDDLSGTMPMSHVQKVLHDLGVNSIAAHSPQAKGRIERLWKTLQDRLCKEMRLAQINTLEQANQFLPQFIKEFNATFSRTPISEETEWVEMLPGADMDYLFSMQETRTVKPDHTISFEGEIFQIKASSRKRSLSGQTISVRTNPEGKTFLYDGKSRLQYSIVTERPKMRQPAKTPSTDFQTKTKPTLGRRAFMFAKP
jgi:transposase